MQQQLIEAILSVILAFIITGVILAALGYNPLNVFASLFQGALGTPIGIGYTLGQLVPLIFTGLCAVVAFRGGMWNVGGEGQLFIGATGAEIVGILHIYAGIHLVLAVVVGALLAGLWGGLAGFLRAYYHVDELVSTIMMNFIAIALVTYLVIGPIKDTMQEFMIVGIPITTSAEFPQLIGYGISSVIILAIIAAIALHYLMERSTFGFATRLVESNPLAADYAGVNTKRNQIEVMFLSGCLGGLAGVALVCGNVLPFGPAISPGFGYVGMAIAFLASLNVLLVIPAAALFAILYAGGNVIMGTYGIPVQLVSMVSALVIIAFLASGPLFKKLREVLH
jgi:simple sugar transport system permease protein